MTEAISSEEAIYSTFGDDPDLGELVDMFVDEMSHRVESFLKSFLEEDWEGLRRMAHQLKGAAGSYGFDQITSLAGQLEEVLRSNGSEEDIAESLDNLLSLCRRIRPGVAP